MSTETALWRRLDVPGHDAARLERAPDGWRLIGTAVFRHGGAPACLAYAVSLDAGWVTRRARVRGFLGEKAVDRRIERSAAGVWTVAGQVQPGVAGLADLDLGFTPATNLQQLRRVGLAVGAEAALPVAWLDAGADELVALPQRYRRLDGASYDYAAPSVGYEAVLTLAASGFVADYPGLWRMEGGQG
jgi:hypothetical protein